MELSAGVVQELTTVLTVALRLVLAVVLGGLVGYERETSHRPAGLRTHVLVALGSALVMLVSTHMFESFRGLTNVDPGRIAAQVVSGIGFLGAGTIMREGLTIRGLTTAASLWVVAGIGLAVGSGYYGGAIGTALLAVFALVTLSRVERRFISKASLYELTLTVKDRPGMLGKIGSVLGTYNVNIRNVQMVQHVEKKELLEIHLSVMMPNDVDLPSMSEELMSQEGVLSVRTEE